MRPEPGFRQPRQQVQSAAFLRAKSNHVFVARHPPSVQKSIQRQAETVTSVICITQSVSFRRHNRRTWAPSVGMKQARELQAALCVFVNLTVVVPIRTLQQEPAPRRVTR